MLKKYINNQTKSRIYFSLIIFQTSTSDTREWWWLQTNKQTNPTTQGFFSSFGHINIPALRRKSTKNSGPNSNWNSIVFFLVQSKSSIDHKKQTNKRGKKEREKNLLQEQLAGTVPQTAFGFSFEKKMILT